MIKFNEYRTIQKPQKKYRCVWCHQSIQEPHLQFIGTWEGEFQNWRVHNECKKPMESESEYGESGMICSGPHGRGKKCEC